MAPAFRSLAIIALGAALVVGCLSLGYWLEDESAPLALQLPWAFVFLVTIIAAPLLSARQVRGLWALVVGTLAFITFTWAIIITSQANRPDPDADSGLGTLFLLIFAVGLALFVGPLIGFLSQIGKRRTPAASTPA
jgi:FtsH-binding integral membrane protein